MSDDRFPELTPEEQEAFRAMSRERRPPDELEDRVVEALANQGLVRRSPARQRHVWALAATALLALGLGFLGGRFSAAPPPPVGDDDSPRFILLLYDTPEREAARTSERERQLASEYGAWAGELATVDRFVAGDPIHGEGRMLRKIDQRVEAGPAESGEGGEMVVGYFMIRAADYQEALEIAEDCPHLKYDGGVLVRQAGLT
ncbi:MAG: hypothetical protein GY719_15125 [bacterium]|nr:hypothetical protein [bacterium]